MGASVTPPPALSRMITTAIVGLATIVGIGTAVKFVGNTPNGPAAGGSGSVVFVLGSSGATAEKHYASGSVVLSGSLVVGHKGAGSGHIVIKGAKGGSQCYDNTNGVGCVCVKFNHGAPIYYSGSTVDCTPNGAN